MWDAVFFIQLGDQQTRYMRKSSTRLVLYCDFTILLSPKLWTGQLLGLSSLSWQKKFCIHSFLVLKHRRKKRRGIGEGRGAKLLLFPYGLKKWVLKGIHGRVISSLIMFYGFSRLRGIAIRNPKWQSRSLYLIAPLGCETWQLSSLWVKWNNLQVLQP